MDAELDPRRYPTPTGQPCPRCLRVDGAVEGSGACVGCGTCLLFGGLIDPIPDPEDRRDR